LSVMRKLFLFLLLLLYLFQVPVLAQTRIQTALWYFGKNAGVDFRSGSPVALTDGMTYTEEGTSSICDPQGNLLFYTNGVKVWNRQHKTMPNGQRLMGHSSSTQSALIVPRPGSPNLYYIFTVDLQASANGLRYSVVDMNKEEGLGDLIQKNEFLITPVTEKLTAITHRNGKDIWVLAHRWNSNAYYAFLVTANGITGMPVTSHAGSVHGGPARNSIGYLKPSPDGTKLATALWKETHKFEILDFNNATGVVSNPVTLEGYEEAYGVEFSPDGSKLYGGKNGTGGGKAEIFQFNLRAGSPQAIAKSATLIGSTSSRKVGALLLAPDGKIYVARDKSPYLGVIQNPNAPGKACGYVDEGFHLAGRKSELGLPNFIHNFFL
jgi:WD40 repeat protein